MRETILQFEHHSLRGLAADAGNRGEPRQIAAMDRADELGRLDARQHGYRQLRPDAADRDQPLEELLFQRREEPVQLQRFFAHVRVDAQGDVGADVTRIVKRD